MTPVELVARLREAGCRVHVHRGMVVVLTKREEIFNDLRARGAQGLQYVRNPWGARYLDEAAIVEYDVTLRPGMTGVTGTGGEPVTSDDLLAAVR